MKSPGSRFSLGPHWDVIDPKGKHKNVLPGGKNNMKTESEFKVVCKAVWYYSKIDEELFFNWLQKIKSIEHFDGIGDELYLYFKTPKIPDEDLRELLALFYRYKIDMKQLKAFLNDDNKEWFYGRPKGFWHRKVFGKSE